MNTTHRLKAVAVIIAGSLVSMILLLLFLSLDSYYYFSKDFSIFEFMGVNSPAAHYFGGLKVNLQYYKTEY